LTWVLTQNFNIMDLIKIKIKIQNFTFRLPQQSH
jgi:hypothetical protein